MAFYDWNNNGKKDLVDDYLEYNIYKECTKNIGPSGSSGSSSSLLIVFIVICIILYIIGSLVEPKSICMEIGCMEKCSESSIYCEEHKFKYK